MVLTAANFKLADISELLWGKNLLQSQNSFKFLTDVIISLRNKEVVYVANFFGSYFRI